MCNVSILGVSSRLQDDLTEEIKGAYIENLLVVGVCVCTCVRVHVVCVYMCVHAYMGAWLGVYMCEHAVLLHLHYVHCVS